MAHQCKGGGLWSRAAVWAPVLTPAPWWAETYSGQVAQQGSWGRVTVAGAFFLRDCGCVPAACVKRMRGFLDCKQ